MQNVSLHLSCATSATCLRKDLPFGAISNMLRLKHNIDLSPDEVPPTP